VSLQVVFQQPSALFMVSI